MGILKAGLSEERVNTTGEDDEEVDGGGDGGDGDSRLLSEKKLKCLQRTPRFHFHFLFLLPFSAFLSFPLSASLTLCH